MFVVEKIEKKWSSKHILTCSYAMPRNFVSQMKKKKSYIPYRMTKCYVISLLNKQSNFYSNRKEADCVDYWTVREVKWKKRNAHGLRGIICEKGHDYRPHHLLMMKWHQHHQLVCHQHHPHRIDEHIRIAS